MAATLASTAEAIITVASLAMVGLVVAALVAYYRTRRWLQQHGVRTSGRILRLETDPNDYESTALFPVVQFQPLGHPTLVIRYDIGQHPAAFLVGQAVVVCYDPAQPTRFEMNVDAPEGPAWLVALLVVAAVGAGIYCYLQS